MDSIIVSVGICDSQRFLMRIAYNLSVLKWFVASLRTACFDLPSFNRSRKFANIPMNQPKPPHRHWTSEEEELLGRKSDRALARKFGRSVAAVAARRRQHQISLIRPWRPADDKLLGIRPDEQVALLLKRPRHQVAYRRRQLGIPFKHPDYHQWKPGEVAMLGWRTDEEVARLTGRTSKNVRHKRLKLGIPFYNPNFRPWTAEEDSVLGTMPDVDVKHSPERRSIYELE
jgi:hypothetical protein